MCHKFDRRDCNVSFANLGWDMHALVHESISRKNCHIAPNDSRIARRSKCKRTLRGVKREYAGEKSRVNGLFLES